MWTWRALVGLSIGTLFGCHLTHTEEASPVSTETTRPAAVDSGAIDGAEDVEAPFTGPFLHALARMTPVVSAMTSSPAALGYLRRGAKVAASGPIVNESCVEGWYALAEGGFVCGKWASLDASDRRLKDAPPAPALDQALPYRYAYNTTNGTPLYRYIPPAADRARYESTEQVGIAGDDAPWYLKDWDGGKPQVTLDELQGEGAIARRMVKGFAVAVDVNAQA